MRQRFMRAMQMGLVAVLVATGITVVASPAMADTTCPASSYICVWTSPNYTGTANKTNVFFSCQNFAGAMDENITSLKVSASPAANDWKLYFGYNCTGAFVLYNNGTQIADLAAGADNVFSSVIGA
jgi:hypothetical protein